MLKLEKSVHNMLSVQVVSDTKRAKLLANVVGASMMDSEDYKVRTKARAFLQGYDEKEGWALVEFWTDNKEDCQAFVDHVNALYEAGYDY